MYLAEISGPVWTAATYNPTAGTDEWADISDPFDHLNLLSSMTTDTSEHCRLLGKDKKMEKKKCSGDTSSGYICQCVNGGGESGTFFTLANHPL